MRRRRGGVARTIAGGAADRRSSLDDNDSDVHRILAALNLNFNEYDKAVYHQERALSLNPNSDLIVVQQGEVLTWLGRPQEGIEWIRKAMRLNPYHPERFWSHLGRAQFTAQALCRRAAVLQPHHRPDQTHHAFMAAASAQMGNADGGEPRMRAKCSRALRTSPIAAFLATLHYKPRRGSRALPRGTAEGRPAGVAPSRARIADGEGLAPPLSLEGGVHYARHPSPKPSSHKGERARFTPDAPPPPPHEGVNQLGLISN